jgi:hypothetical protein
MRARSRLIGALEAPYVVIARSAQIADSGARPSYAGIKGDTRMISDQPHLADNYPM